MPANWNKDAKNSFGERVNKRERFYKQIARCDSKREVEKTINRPVFFLPILILMLYELLGLDFRPAACLTSNLFVSAIFADKAAIIRQARRN